MTVMTLVASQALPRLVRQRRLIWELAKRDHSERYAGSMLGAVWAVGHPLALLLIYTVVFSFVFRLNVGGTAAMPLDYTTYLIAGYLPWMAFLESMVRSASSIATNPALVKQAVFPIEVLPVKGAVAAVLTQLVGTAFLVGYVVVVHGRVAWTYVLFPPLLALELLAMAGVALLLGALGAYFRDTKDVVQVASVAGVYLLPIFYLPDWVPGVLRPLLYVNPFSYMVWCYQDVFYYGRIEHPLAWLVFAAGSLAVFAAGTRFFHTVKPYFGNVL